MELDYLKIAPLVHRHGYLKVPQLSKQNYSAVLHHYTCLLHGSTMRKASLWISLITTHVLTITLIQGILLCWKHSSRLMIWECINILYNVIQSNYCCRRHTMHRNMAVFKDYILATPQQSGGSLKSLIWVSKYIRDMTSHACKLPCWVRVVKRVNSDKRRPWPVNDHHNNIKMGLRVSNTNQTANYIYIYWVSRGGGKVRIQGGGAEGGGGQRSQHRRGGGGFNVP